MTALAWVLIGVVVLGWIAVQLLRFLKATADALGCALFGGKAALVVPPELNDALPNVHADAEVRRLHEWNPPASPDERRTPHWPEWTSIWIADSEGAYSAT